MLDMHTHVWKFHWKNNKIKIYKSHGEKFMNLDVIWGGKFSVLLYSFRSVICPTDASLLCLWYCSGNRCCECQMELKSETTIYFLYILMLSMGILLSMKMTMVSYHNSRRKIMRGNCHHWSFITVYYYHHYYCYILYLWRYFLCMAVSLSWVNGSSWEQSSASNYLEKFLLFLPRIFYFRLKWIPKIFLNHFFGICLWREREEKILRC